MTKNIIDLAVNEKPLNREIIKKDKNFLDILVVEAGPSVEDQKFDVGTETLMAYVENKGKYLSCIDCSKPGDAYLRCSNCNEYNK
jgi:hypothetical protein